MFKMIFVFPFLLAFVMATEPETSPWHHTAPEICSHKPEITPSSPLVYPAIWDREREVYSYNPRFMPNLVTFDWFNQPVIRAGVHDPEAFADCANPRHATVYYSYARVDASYLQTLDEHGNWVTQNMNDVLAELVPATAGDTIQSGTFEARHEKVVFDSAGDAYTVVKTKSNGSFLLHGSKTLSTWTAHLLPSNRWIQLEATARDKPPTLLVYQEDDRPGEVESWLYLICPEKDVNGALINLDTLHEIDRDLKQLAVGEKSVGNLFGTPGHSGMGELTVTVGSKTHVVYGSTRPVSQMGTPQYIVTYDRNTGIASPPLLLGTTTPYGSNPTLTDNHCGPAIVVDSEEYLHVVLGAHGRDFKYLKSTQPNDAQTWTNPINVSNSITRKNTYVSLVIDAADTLHLVSRMRDNNFVRALHYMRKTKSGSWEDRGQLVVAAPEHYSIFYHKLSIDERGRLFLAYFYYSHDLSDEELAAYHEKWPGEPSITKDKTWAHDPAIIMSDNHGDSWRIALSKDFKTPKLTINNRTSSSISLRIVDEGFHQVTLNPFKSWGASDTMQITSIDNLGPVNLKAHCKLKNGISYTTNLPPGGSWGIPFDMHTVNIDIN